MAFDWHRLKLSKSAIHLIAGIVLGFVFTSQLRTFHFQWKTNKLCSFQDLSNRETQSRSIVLDEIIKDLKRNASNTNQNLVLIGVMTAQKYLDSRALAIYETWGKAVPGQIIFFSSSSSRTEYGLPLVPLPTVDDSYPPQKKSFLMLKFIHDNFIDNFEFFMRADDDVYVDTEKLERFLRSINSSETLFIGQAGVGNKEEFGQLNLKLDENFCMGGPGMIMSKATLKILNKNVQYCLKHLYSTHEDVEVGRCVKRFAGISCTWNYEMQKLFHHNATSESGYSNGAINAKEVNDAVTLHPVKNPINLHKIHYHVRQNKHKMMRYKLTELHREIQEMKEILKGNEKFNYSINELETGNSVLLGSPLRLMNSRICELINSSCLKESSVINWDFIGKHVYSSSNINPKRHIEGHLRSAFESNIYEIMHLINQYSKERGRIIDFKNLYYAYVRLDPLLGTQYILDLLMVYKKYRGRKMTVPVRRHAYAIQTFSKPAIREISLKSVAVNVILPLSGRLEAFKRFMENFENILKVDKELTLAVVLFPDAAENPEELNQTKNYLKRLEDSGTVVKTAELGGFFSRAAALQRGATLYSRDALLFFVDVDMHFTANVLSRVRFNTVPSVQVYFPIVFSQFSPNFTPDWKVNTFKLTDNDGYWRQFGFGIVALYNHDLQSVGGLNIAIQGWGKEDVDLFDKFVHSNLTIFRSVDPGLIHIYHDINCDRSLTATQFEMCIGTKLSSLGSVEALAKHIILNKFLKL